MIQRGVNKNFVCPFYFQTEGMLEYMFPMICNGERVMVLNYKPCNNSIIKDDHTGNWYKVNEIIGRNILVRSCADPYESWRRENL